MYGSTDSPPKPQPLNDSSTIPRQQPSGSSGGGGGGPDDGAASHTYLLNDPTDETSSSPSSTSHTQSPQVTIPAPLRRPGATTAHHRGTAAPPLSTTLPSSRSERSVLGNRMFVASALNPLGNVTLSKFTQADEEVPYFDLRPGSRMENETIRSPSNLQRPLLNLGEFLVEGGAAVMQDPNAPADEHGVFESFFDLTKPRLKMIFDALDASSGSLREGVADFQQLRRGLADAGVKVDDESAFARLVSIVDQDLDGGLTFNEFEAVVQSLKMAYLMRTMSDHDLRESLGTPSAPKVKVLDYSVARVAIRYPNPQDISGFLYGPRPDFATTRWVDITSPCDFILKGLAVKYRFHPLALEDALHLEFDNTAKVDKYDNHLFLVFPGMVLENIEHVPRKSDAFISPQPTAPGGGVPTYTRDRFPRPARRVTRLLRSTSSTSTSQQSFKKPLLSTMDNNSTRTNEEKAAWEADMEQDDTDRILAAFPGVEHFNVCMFLTWPEADTLVTEVDESAGGAVFRRVREELQVSYSRLRSQNALFLMYTVLDVLVDGYIPIMDAFETHLASLRVEVRENAARKGILFDPQADTQFLARYHDVLHELNKARRRISPAIRVIHHLTEIPEVDAQCRIYLMDVLDHAQDVIERLESMIEDCRAIKVEQQSANDGKLTKSMAALTVVGVIFLPAQFLASVMGMNFKHMPGINSDWGFFFFCVATIVSWVVMWALFRRYHVV